MLNLMVGTNAKFDQIKIFKKKLVKKKLVNEIGLGLR